MSETKVKIQTQTYLLKADPSLMSAWQKRAAEEGVSFAQWLRDAAEAHAARPLPAPTAA